MRSNPVIIVLRNINHLQTTVFTFIGVYHNKASLPIAVAKHQIVKEAAPALLLSHNWAVGCCTHTGLQS